MDIRNIDIFANMSEASVAYLETHLKWKDVLGGETIINQNDPADAVYIIVLGRFSVEVDGEEVDILGPGDIVGETAVLTQTTRNATIRASRDGKVGYVSAEDFLGLLMESPKAGLVVAQVLAGRSPLGKSMQPKVLAFIPLDKSPQTTHFIQQFCESFQGQSSPYEVITSERVNTELGDGIANSHPGESGFEQLRQWLFDIEKNNQAVILIGEPGCNGWTDRCIRQSDRVLLVANGKESSNLKELEEKYISFDGKRGVQLILVQEAHIKQASHTMAWLKPRNFLPHHHVRQNNQDDLARIRRSVFDSSIGLVFSGGGSRAPAHLGLVRAVRELGLPIDVVSGTSSGSAVSGLLAMGMDHQECMHHAINMCSKLKIGLSELQPIKTSITSARTLEELLKYSAGERLMEDQLIPMYATAVNIANNSLVTLNHGPIWRGCRASMGLPIIFPPVSIDDQLLVDGGLMSNFPIDPILPHSHRGLIIGCDLDSKTPGERVLPDADAYGATLSGWKQFFRSLIPGLKPMKAPGLSEVMVESMRIVSNVERQNLKAFEEQKHVAFIRPELSNFGLFEVNEKTAKVIEEESYQIAIQMLEEKIKPLLDKTLTI